MCYERFTVVGGPHAARGSRFGLHCFIICVTEIPERT
jgi:hypothetical protein